jgi:hypothetical protein
VRSANSRCADFITKIPPAVEANKSLLKKIHLVGRKYKTSSLMFFGAFLRKTARSLLTMAQSFYHSKPYVIP